MQTVKYFSIICQNQRFHKFVKRLDLLSVFKFSISLMFLEVIKKILFLIKTTLFTTLAEQQKLRKIIKQCLHFFKEDYFRPFCEVHFSGSLKETGLHIICIYNFTNQFLIFITRIRLNCYAIYDDKF